MISHVLEQLDLCFTNKPSKFHIILSVELCPKPDFLFNLFFLSAEIELYLKNYNASFSSLYNLLYLLQLFEEKIFLPQPSLVSSFFLNGFCLLIELVTEIIKWHFFFHGYSVSKVQDEKFSLVIFIFFFLTSN